MTTTRRLSLNNIKAIMADTKDYIDYRMNLSSPSFYDDIRNEEIADMCDRYPDIDALSATAFQFLFKKAGLIRRG